MKNQIESIKAKLRNISKESNRSHQLTLTRYFQERLLFRLSQSDFQDRFFLKGGVLIYVLEGETTRPTLDLDLLARKIEADREKIKAIFQEVCRIPSPGDGVVFNAESLETSEIVKEGNYPGIRVKINANLGNIRQWMQVDIGFGDVVVPGPVSLRFPTLLDMPPPELLAYSTESLIAEKFEAMINLAELNSRMKDFYDVYRILRVGKYDERILQKAIADTITRRKTTLSLNHVIFSDQFKGNERRNAQWQAFLRKANLNSGLSFSEVMDLIKEKLYPIYSDLTG